MIKKFIVLLFLLIARNVFSQDAPNVSNSAQLSPNSAVASMAGSTDVNFFTGIPDISIPLYSYAGQGMSLSVSADFVGGGGIKDGEQASIIGMGWYLNAGGVITRTVRGVPDDLATYGYLNAAAIPNDFRSNANKYYHDSLDAEPDVFSFNFNGRSGKFIIGKNNQIVIIPQSQLKIEYTTDASTQLINSFKITTESGVKYLFALPESTNQTFHTGSQDFINGLAGNTYNSAWYLSRIISPLTTDSITFSYLSKSTNTSFTYPVTSFYKTSDQTLVKSYSATGNNYSTILKLSTITFPDKTQVSLVYSNVSRYDDTDYAISKLKVSDSIFRKGFMFNYQTSYTGNIIEYFKGKRDTINTTYPTNLLLQSIIPYTSKEYSKGYSFTYYVPYPNYHNPLATDSALNTYDYWGFFNATFFQNSPVPFISGINNTGTNRYPNFPSVLENSLSDMYLPEGGVVHYDYEQNNTGGYTNDAHQLSVTNSTASSSNNILLSQKFSPNHKLVFSYANTLSRTGNPPLSGTCNLTCNIKSTDGATLYATGTISLYTLYYAGVQTWQFGVPNGTYLLETSLSGGGSITGTYQFNIGWTNKLSSASNLVSGGIRLKRITSYPATGDSIHSIVKEFKYTKADGTSSGFFGDVPQYYYPFQQTISSPSSTTSMNAVTSDPVNSLSFSDGNLVGYSRVQVFNGSASNNLGYTIYDYTGLSDVKSNYFFSTFPFAPQDLKDWGIGLPKRVSVYDSSDNLVSTRTNAYTFNTTGYVNSNFKGLKLGCSATTYTNDPNTYPTTPRVNTYLGQEYYPSSGWARLDSTADTIYHTDGSLQASTIKYTYDSYQQVSKISGPYSRNKGLSIETRIYYPYNYNFTSGAVKTLKDSSIITQVVSTEKWITGDANPRIVDATITNFYQLPQNYIVPQYVYKFQSNAPVNQTTIGTFDPSNLVRNSTYFVQQASFPSHYSNGTTAQQNNVVSGELSTIICDYNLQYTTAKVSNAAHSDVAYTSFESDGLGNWTTIGSALRNQGTAITGKQSYILSNGDITKTGLNAALTYVLTVWVKTGSFYVNGTATTRISTHQGWGLYTITLTGITSITLTGTGTIDELRLCPKDANMITYTYEPNVGVTSTCDANNTIVYTQYDNLNRIKLLRDGDNNILKRYDYSNGSYPISVLPNWVGTGRVCEDDETGAGRYDSVYTDMNQYSDTYSGKMKVYKGTNLCLCNGDASYKTVNGVCEHSKKWLMSTSYDPETQLYTCNWHYQWSDGSTLPVNYNTYFTSIQSTDCGTITH